REEYGFIKAIGLFDGTMIVVGSMIGSGIFIVSADIARQTGSAGGLLVTWVLTGILTVAAALSYGELAALFPHAGGQYVYLREAYSPLWGFLSSNFAGSLGDSPHQSRIEICHQFVRSAACGDPDDRAADGVEHAGGAAGQADPEHFYFGEDAGANRIGGARSARSQESGGDCG